MQPPATMQQLRDAPVELQLRSWFLGYGRAEKGSSICSEYYE